MRTLSMEECNEVAGAEVCNYASAGTMFSSAGMAGATAGMAGFALGGPAVGGIASAGVASATLFAMGGYNFFMLGWDLLGGCVGYTGC